MFLVVNLHVLGQGGVMVRVVGNEIPYYVSWFLETCAYCAVDCYGLISGYVGVDHKARPARFIELWLQVFFYSAGITLIFWMVKPYFLDSSSLWKAVFPVSWKTYWYFSSYAGVFFLMPYLNRLMDSLNTKEVRRLAVTLFLVFSVATALPKVNGSDFLNLGGGYSFVWLMVLYLLGACIRRGNFARWKKRYYLLSYFALSAFSWAFKILVENYTRNIYGEARYGRLFTGYAAPTMVLCAVCLLLIFEDIEIKNTMCRKMIRLAAPLAFSVYLIHTHPLVFNYLMKNAFSFCRSLPVVCIIPSVMGCAALIYVVCSVIDLGRKKLFDIVIMCIRIRTDARI